MYDAPPILFSMITSVAKILVPKYLYNSKTQGSPSLVTKLSGQKPLNNSIWLRCTTGKLGKPGFFISFNATQP